MKKMNEMLILKIFFVISCLLLLLSFIGMLFSRKNKDLYFFIISLLIALTIITTIIVSYNYIKLHGTEVKFIVLFYSFFAVIDVFMLIEGYHSVLSHNKSKLYDKEQNRQDNWK